MHTPSRMIHITLTLMLVAGLFLATPAAIAVAQKGGATPPAPAAPDSPQPAQGVPVKPTVNRPPTQGPQPTATATPVPPTPVPPAELDIDKVEPSRLPTALGGVLSILGSGFTPGCLVRLVDYGLLETTYVSDTMLKAVVPPNVRPAKYDVEVKREDGAEDEKDDALRIDPVEVIPTATPRPDPTVQPTIVPGRPQLVIEAFDTDPAELVADSPFTVTITLANRGNRTANNVLLSVSDSVSVVPVGGSNATTVSPVGVGQAVSTTLRLADPVLRKTRAKA